MPKLKSRFRAFFDPHRYDKGKPVAGPALMTLYEYGDNGSFDYARYRESQIAKAGKDVGDVWADEKTLNCIADYARDHMDPIEFVLCHGSKAGMESRYLGERLGCEAMGTDIAPPVSACEVVEWDFHEPNAAWIGRASLVYTNALDHAYDPKKAMDAWFDQLAEGGMIFIEHTMLHAPAGASASDPFGAHPYIMPYLILDWGRGRYCVRDIIRPIHKKPHWKNVDGARADTDLDIWIFVVAAVGR